MPGRTLSQVVRELDESTVTLELLRVSSYCTDAQWGDAMREHQTILAEYNGMQRGKKVSVSWPPRRGARNASTALSSPPKGAAWSSGQNLDARAGQQECSERGFRGS